MDLDADLLNLEKGDWSNALNIRNGNNESHTAGAIANTDGIFIVNNPFLIGSSTDNSCIGTYEDLKENTSIYFIWNRFGYHGIYRYYRDVPNNGLGTIEKLVRIEHPTLYTAENPNPLGFEENVLITGIVLVDGLLAWANPATGRRMLNVDKANETRKRRKFDLYFHKDNFLVNRTYRLSLFAHGNPVPINVYDFNTSATTYQATCAAFIENFATTVQPQTFYACTNRGSFIEIEIVRYGQFFLTVEESIDNFATTERKSVITPENFYPEKDLGIEAGGTPTYNIFSIDLIDAIKYPSFCEPIPVYKTDPLLEVNLVRDKYFQFRTKYVYDYYENTTYGTTSKVPMPLSRASVDVGISENYIEIDFNDERLINPSLLCEVRNVVVSFSDDGRATWKDLAALEVYEFAGGQKFNFYNSGTFSVVDPAEAALPYSAEPIKTGALELVDDRQFLGDLTEGRDRPDIIATVEQQYEVDPAVQRYSIRGRIYIKDHYTDDFTQRRQFIYRKHYTTQGNPANPTTNVFGGFGVDELDDNDFHDNFIPENVGQTIPNAGWVVYLAGTDYLSVSKQTISPLYNPATVSPPPPTSTDIRTLIAGDGVFDLFNIDDAKTVFYTADPDQVSGQNYVYSEFEIKNVPAGTYALRLSCHAIPDSSLVNDFFASRAYQRTSTNIGVVGVASGGSTEFIVTVSNADVNLGDTEVYNMGGIGTSLINNNQAYYRAQQVYLRGNDVVGTTPAEIYGDVSIPRATAMISYNGGGAYLAEVKTGVGTTVLVKTDHNGYFFYYNADRLSQSSDTKTTEATSGLYSDPLSDATKYLYSTAGAVPAGGSFLPYFCRVDSANIKAYSRTFVNGRFTGQQLDNISVVPSLRSPGITASDGTFRVLVYAETYNPAISTNTTVQMYFAPSDANTILLLPLPTSTPLLQYAIPADGITTFNEAVPYVFPSDFTNIIIVGALSISVWKPGSETIFGIVYADDGDRKCAVCTLDTLKVKVPYIQPTTTQQGETFIRLNLFHEPPVWATKYYIVRTEDLVQTQFFQWVADSVEYVTSDLTTSTAYSNADAAFLKINLGNIDYYRNNQYPDAFLPSENWNKGDIVRVIANNAGVPFGTVYEYEIVKGVSATNNDIFLYKDPSVDFSGAPGFGLFMEIYRPRNTGNLNLFYECECFPVRTAFFNGVRKRYHVGNEQDQSYGTLPLNDVTPAIIKLTRGNAYTRLRNMSVNVPPATPIQFNVQKIYDESISDFYASRVQSLGRVNSDSITVGQVYSPSAEMFTDRYISSTKINGLCKIQPLNRKQFSTDYGAIRKLQIYNDEILVAFFQNSITIPQYINKGILREATGQSIVAISEDVIPRSNQMKKMAGTQNPESVVIDYNNNIFALDVAVGVPMRDSGNGIIDIGAIKTAKFWSNESRVRKYPGRTPSVFDLRNNMYIITLGPLSPSKGEAPTCTFKLPDFDTEYPYAPTQTILTGKVYPSNNFIFNIARNNPLFPSTGLMIVFFINANTATTGYSAVLNSDGSVTVTAPMNSSLFGNNTLTIDAMYPVGATVVNRQFNFSFTPGRDADIVSEDYTPKTIAFNPKTYDNDSLSRNRWFTFYSFIPEMYGRVGQSVISFVDGQLWLHDVPGIPNNFYGVQYPSRITMAVNDEFTQVKNFRSIAVKATTKWYVPRENAVIPPNEQYPQGMKSEVPPQLFKEEEGKYYAEFLQDALTPNAKTYYEALINGRDLLGNVLEITLQHDDTIPTLLYFSEVNYFISYPK